MIYRKKPKPEFPADQKCALASCRARRSKASRSGLCVSHNSFLPINVRNQVHKAVGRGDPTEIRAAIARAHGYYND